MYIIYKIVCAANGKIYVGYTSKTAEERFETHLLNARWKRKTALYNAIRRYGADAFAVEEIARCGTHAEACEKEIFYIASLGSKLPLGYNMTTGGDGVPLTPEQREAANAKKRGVCSLRQWEASQRRIGSKASAETRAKLSAARRGRKQSPECVAKRKETIRRNREERAAAGLADTPRPREPRPPRPRRPRVWTAQDREKERQRALAQWTPEARAAAKERAAKQWTPEARAKVSERMTARYAKLKRERLEA